MFDLAFHNMDKERSKTLWKKQLTEDDEKETKKSRKKGRNSEDED